MEFLAWGLLEHMNSPKHLVRVSGIVGQNKSKTVFGGVRAYVLIQGMGVSERF